MVDMTTLILQLDTQLGLIDILLPFILIFAITFALADRLPMFNRQTSTMIGLVMALTAIGLHVLQRYPPCWDVIVIIQNALPKVGLVLIAIVAFMLIVAIFGIDMDFFQNSLGLVAIGSIGFIAYTFLTGGGQHCGFDINLPYIWPYLTYLIPFLIFGLIIFFVTRSDDSDIY